MKNVIFITLAMLPLLAACAPEMAKQQTTTTTTSQSYTAPYPEVVEQKRTTTVTVQPSE